MRSKLLIPWIFAGLLAGSGIAAAQVVLYTTRPDRRSRRRVSANGTACGGPLERREQPLLPLPHAPIRTYPYRMAEKLNGRHGELGLRLGDN
jgi:hypothetical protein